MSRSTNAKTLLAQGTTGRIRRATEQGIGAVPVIAYSQLEEEFFSAGDKLSTMPILEIHDFSDLDVGHRPRTIWRTVMRWLRGEHAEAEQE